MSYLETTSISLLLVALGATSVVGWTYLFREWRKP